MKTYTLSSNYILQNVGTDKVLLPCGTDNDVDLTKMIVLNDTAAFYIGCMENTSLTFEQLIHYIVDSYDELPDNYEQDLKEFIQEMSDKGILIESKNG